MLVRITPHMVWYGLVWYGMAWYGLGPRLGDAPLGHEQKLVVVDDGVEPVRDGQDGRAWEAAANDALDHLHTCGLQPRAHMRVAASSTQGHSSFGRGLILPRPSRSRRWLSPG